MKMNRMKGAAGLAMKKKLVKHSKGKSAAHMSTMVKMLSEGKSFAQAHLAATMKEKGRQVKMLRKAKKSPRYRGKGTRSNPIDLTKPPKKRKRGKR